MVCKMLQHDQRLQIYNSLIPLDSQESSVVDLHYIASPLFRCDLECIQSDQTKYSSAGITL